MTPGARLAAAIEILDAVEAAGPAGRPADRVVQEAFRARRYMGSKDRRAVGDLIFSVLRARARLGWWLERGGLAATARGRVLSHLALVDTMAPEAAAETWDAGRYGPDPLTGEERAYLEGLPAGGLDRPDQPPEVALEMPAWLLPELRRSLPPEELELELRALQRPAPLDLRVNRLKATVETALEALAAEGFEARPLAWPEGALSLEGRPALHAARALREGLVEIQDRASQLAAGLVGAAPGMTVLDLCAGAGGKTLALAADMAARPLAPPEGRLLACDTDRERLRRAGSRLERAGAGFVESRLLDGGRDPREALADLAGRCERVLVDAPCSGTGTWRREPFARWRLDERALAGHLEVQSRLLRSAAALVRPGGRLAYATCSLLRSENEDRVEAFLASTAGRDFAPQLPGLPPALWAVPGPLGLRLRPGRDGCDGFFVASLFRRS